MPAPYTIPEIARLTGIPEAILHADVEEFAGIVPDSRDTDGRRRFPAEAVTVLRAIHRLREQGLDRSTIHVLLQRPIGPARQEPDAGSDGG